VDDSRTQKTKKQNEGRLRADRAEHMAPSVFSQAASLFCLFSEQQKDYHTHNVIFLMKNGHNLVLPH